MDSTAIETDMTEQIMTPLVRVQLAERQPAIWCKLEYLNPSGSTKDRIARFILGKALRQRVIQPGGWVIEASSGSTSIALALASAQLNLKFLAVMPTGVSEERIRMIRAFGAEVELTPKEDGMSCAIDVARQRAQERHGFLTEQFCNPDNPLAHRHQTAQEIMHQIPGGCVDAVVSGVGTGGTLVGLYQGLTDFGCEVIPVLARPTTGSEFSEPECYSFSGCIPGVVDGMSQIFQSADLPQLREENVPDALALETARALIRRGFPVGPSSGLNFQAALQAAEELPPECIIVTVFPDRMERYFSTNLFLDSTANPSA